VRFLYEPVTVMGDKAANNHWIIREGAVENDPLVRKLWHI